MRGLLSTSLVVLGFLAAAAATAGADTITWESGGYVGAYAYDGVDDSSYLASSASSGVITRSDGAASARTSWNLTATTASFGFDGVAGGAFQSYAVHEANLFFTIEADRTYSISGAYTFSDFNDLVSSSEYASLSCFLWDETASQYLFDNGQYTDAADDGMFDLSGTSENSTFLGSLNGSLLAGHHYRFYFGASVQHYLEDGDYPTLHGYGSVTLTIVPLPPSALMGLTLLSGLGLAKILRKRKERALA